MPNKTIIRLSGVARNPANGFPARLLAKDGIAIQRAINVQVSDHVEVATLQTVAGYLVPVVNATCYQSEIGDQLNARYPDSPFAACYFERADGRRQWSLRSKGNFDVSEVAQRFGGGGHCWEPWSPGLAHNGCYRIWRRFPQVPALPRLPADNFAP